MGMWPETQTRSILDILVSEIGSWMELFKPFQNLETWKIMYSHNLLDGVMFNGYIEGHAVYSNIVVQYQYRPSLDMVLPSAQIQEVLYAQTNQPSKT